MQKKIKHLENYFQMYVIIGFILVISGMLSQFKEQQTAVRIAYAFIFPTVIVSFLLCRLKSDAAQMPDEEETAS